MKPWALGCVVTLALLVVPTTADAVGVLVTVSPDQQTSNGHGTIDIDVAIVAGASSTCRLLHDGQVLQVWQPCKEHYALDASDLDDGGYRLAARAKKDDVRDWAASYFTVDTTGPRTEVRSQYPRVLTKRSFYVSWSLKRRDTSPTFTVQARHDTPFRDGGGWQTRGRTDGNSMRFGIVPGGTVCVRVRATDALGNVGPWSRELCRTRYLDDRELDGWRHTRDWTPVQIGSNLQDTGLVSKAQGAVVTLPSLRVADLVLLGREGPSGGSIEIRLGGEVVRQVSLQCAEPGRATLFRSDWHSPREGRLAIEVTSADGRYVHLDALVLRRR